MGSEDLERAPKECECSPPHVDVAAKETKCQTRSTNERNDYRSSSASPAATDATAEISRTAAADAATDASATKSGAAAPATCGALPKDVQILQVHVDNADWENHLHQVQPSERR